MNERAIAFGPERSLVGIYTPAGGDPDPKRPTVVLLNSGVIHRVGVHRVHVRLARRLAGLGYATLRFDLSGIGDSRTRPDAGSVALLDAVDADIHDALDYLRSKHHAERFVLAGLCSGAQDALRTAAAAPAVVGAALIDIPGSFRNWRHYAVHFGRRALRGASWRNALTGRNRYSQQILQRLTPAEGLPQADDLGVRADAPRDRMADELTRVLRRDGRLLVVFTSGVEQNYNHRDQFAEVFPEAAAHPNLAFEFFDGADHTFSGESDRLHLMGTVCDWVVGLPG